MTIREIVARAKKMNRVSKEGLVLCDNCDNPASASLSQQVGWTACAPCVWGEADSLDESDFISVESERAAQKRNSL